MMLADPERALAVAYAPSPARAALAALFALDERMGAIVASTTEPMIGLMRLAWWREALEQLDQDAVPAEPLLQDVAKHIVPLGVRGASLGAIEDGWAALLDSDAVQASALRHGHERGCWLFAAAATILGATDERLPSAGEGWALADLAHRHGNAQMRAAARDRAQTILGGLGRQRWPRAARPLAALAVLARRDVASAVPRAQGSPARVARMLALRLTGR